ncbi:MAG TPA: 50S ribosomal protein L30 [bacterium]|nr:50S ribosomal protein L30 [bacterium]
MAERVTSAPGRQVKLTLRRSLIGRPPGQRRIVWALGLRRVGAARVHPLTPSVAGAVRKIGHLVSIEEVKHGKTG